MSHTPTPWRCETNETCTYIEAKSPYKLISINTLPNHHSDAEFVVKAVNTYEETNELLADLLEYFDGKQDAETFPDGHTIANEEMKFHMRISAILEGKTDA